jgi:adenylate cyclase
MAGIFRLRGADIYEVLAIERVPGPEFPLPPRPCDPLAALRALTHRIAEQSDLAHLLDAVLSGLQTHFGIDHSMILLTDVKHQRLFTVASHGYPVSGVGAEIPLGQGVIGVAAQFSTPIRINHMTQEVTYSRAIRAGHLQGGLGERIETEIAMPGLPESRSQLAVPIVVGGRVAGVLYAESPADMRFGYADEDALVAVAAQLGMAIAVMQQAEVHENAVPEASAPAPAPRGATAVVRLYRANDSVFIDDEYLIKGVAGNIFVKLVREYLACGRIEFTNRELRLDPTLRLPDISDNLEARLILLQRRLNERCSFVRIEKTGRGRFRFDVGRPLKLFEIG